MNICGLQKLTLLDFPGKLACTVFLGGCNFRCPFCYNAPLVFLEENSIEEISEDAFFEFLQKRKGVLDGVCITGGEPLLSDIEPFVRKIRELGFAVKLDTNGSFPQRLKSLLDAGLIDYVAMDVKNSIARYPETVGRSEFDPAPVQESIRLLLSGGVDYEFRTTVARELHDQASMKDIAELLSGARRYFLQNYSESGEQIGQRLHSFEKRQLEEFQAILRKKIEAVELRGI